jgi:hypothetical protein
MVRALAVTSGLTSQRGARRLLWDCETVGRSLEPDRIPARTRIESELGADITALLLAMLREAEPATPHEEALRRAAYGDAA